jgi:hypothetical protein
VTNVGRRRRANLNVHGYLIDLSTGKWLKENEQDETPEAEGLDDPSKIKRKQRVIPYVEDRRNILVTRLERQVKLDTAVTFGIALERGIEAAFQLEDSELTSQGLPDPDDRGRALLTESAEGGAGVLRRIVDDPEALKQAARTALQIMHFDPDTGNEAVDQFPGQEPCVRACYDCLLSYGNQSLHEQINRHLVKDLLLRLAKADIHTERPEVSAPEQAEHGSVEDRFTAWLHANGYRQPSAIGEEVFGYLADLVYRLDGGAGAAIYFTDEDLAAHDVIRDEGWSVIKIGPGDNWQNVVNKWPSVFGGTEEGNL